VVPEQGAVKRTSGQILIDAIVALAVASIASGGIYAAFRAQADAAAVTHERVLEYLRVENCLATAEGNARGEVMTRARPFLRRSRASRFSVSVSSSSAELQTEGCADSHGHGISRRWTAK